jgi:exosortase
LITQAGKIADGVPSPAEAGRAVTSSAAWAKWLPLVFAAGVLALYAPTLAVAAHEWMINDNYAHGIFIFPLCAFLLWLRRDELRQVERRPTAWGLLPLMAGLIGQCLSYTLQIKYIGMWSLALTLTGGVLVLYGPPMLPFVRFAILFSLLAYPLPHSVLNGMTIKIQAASTAGATALMSALGYPLIQQGNVIQVPGAMLEVAEACSGFHKLLSLTAFTLLYSYLFTTSQGKRLVLLLAVLPIALLVNILRISGLIAAAASGGLNALHAAHDGAEYCAIALAFGLLIVLGRVLGCRTMRFSL